MAPGVIALLVASATLTAGAPAPSLQRTPFGNVHPDCVHEVPSGSHVGERGDGRLHVKHPNGTEYVRERCTAQPSAADALATRRAALARAGLAVGGGGNGGSDHPPRRQLQPSNSTIWSDNSHIFFGATWTTSYIIALNATWTVPPVPASVGGSVDSTLYTWTGIESLSGGTEAVLQPVLGFYGSSGAYDFRSWNCCPSGFVIYSTGFSVAPGDTLYGTMVQSPSNNDLFTTTSSLMNATSGVVLQTTVLVSNMSAVAGGWEPQWAFAIIENYDVTGCNQMPCGTGSPPMVAFTNLTMLTTSGLVPSVPWSLPTSAPYCDGVTTATGLNNGVDIAWDCYTSASITPSPSVTPVSLSATPSLSPTVSATSWPSGCVSSMSVTTTAQAVSVGGFDASCGVATQKFNNGGGGALTLSWTDATPAGYSLASALLTFSPTLESVAATRALTLNSALAGYYSLQQGGECSIPSNIASITLILPSSAYVLNGVNNVVLPSISGSAYSGLFDTNGTLGAFGMVTVTRELLLAGKCSATPTPSITPTKSVSSTLTPTGSITPSQTWSGSMTATATGTVTVTPSGTATGTQSATVTTTPSPTLSPSSTTTVTSSGTFTSSPTLSSSSPPTATSSGTGTATATTTPSSTRTSTPSLTATMTVSASSAQTGTGSQTPTTTHSRTGSITSSMSSSSTETTSRTGSRTDTASATGSPTGTGSASLTGTATATRSSSGTASASLTPPPTASLTRTSTKSSSPTRTSTHTHTATSSSSASSSASGSSSSSVSASVSSTVSPSGTRTGTKTRSPLASPSATAPATQTSTPVSTPSGSSAATPSGSGSGSATPSRLSATGSPTRPSRSVSTSHSSTRSPTGSKSTSKSPSETRSSTRTESGSRTPTRSLKVTLSPSGSRKPKRA